MMIEEQALVLVEKEQLVKNVSEMKENGFRLVQISCTKLTGLEITYTFDKDYKCKNISLTIPAENPVLPSITPVYFCAFTYENELHDLYGINVQGNLLDFGGNFYRTKIKNAFNTDSPNKPEGN